MKLFKLYFTFILKNAIRFPKMATKIIPSLILLVAGIIGSIAVVVLSKPKAFVGLESVQGLMTPVMFNVIFLGIMLYTTLGKTAVIGARASDANFLMPSPITPFELHNFMELKNALGLVGIVLLAIPLYGGQTVSYLKFGWLIFPLYFSMLLTLYIFSFINYISKTSRSYFGRYLKWIVAAYIIANISFGVYLLVTQGVAGMFESMLFKGLPIIGWGIGIIYAIVVWHPVEIIFYLCLQLLTMIAVYYWAKSQTYLYYEEELAYVQKTEAQFKRAYSGEGIALETKFVQTKHQFTQKGEKVLLDMAKIRAGKWWFLNIGMVFKVLLFAIGVFVIGLLYRDGEINDYWRIIIFTGIVNYIRLINAGKKVTAVHEDLYVSLMPFKSIFKLVYTQIMRFRLAFLTTGLFILAALVVNTVILNHVLDNAFMVYCFQLVLATELFDTVRRYIFQPLTINRWFGNFFRQISELLLIVGSGYVMTAPLLHYVAVNHVYIPIIIALVLTAILLMISIKLYDKVEKGKKEESAF